jgi:cytochrome c556
MDLLFARKMLFPVLTAVFLAASALAFGQAQKPDIAKDAIFARKILMDTINNNMDEIEGMISSGKPLPMDEAREHADLVSVMLMAFPHLFPDSTNQWKPNVQRDPGTDTFASPTVWTNFSDFYERAAKASKTAYNASRAKAESDFKAFAKQLRESCDSCHAAYQKTSEQ